MLPIEFLLRMFENGGGSSNLSKKQLTGMMDQVSRHNDVGPRRNGNRTAAFDENLLAVILRPIVVGDAVSKGRFSDDPVIGQLGDIENNHVSPSS